MASEKVVVFGAGRIGQKVINKLTIDIIECVVDNDEKKWGHTINGVPIISFEEYVNNSCLRNCDLIIAIGKTYINQVKKQLELASISNYYVYNGNFGDNYLMEISKLNRIILFGLDEHDMVLRELQRLDLMNRIRAVCDFSDSNNIGKKMLNKVVEPIDRYANSEEAIIIMDSTYYVAAEAYLKQIINRHARIINLNRQDSYFGGVLLVNPYLSTEDKTESEWNLSLEQTIVRDCVDKYVNIVRDNVPLFRYIEIETYNRCNGSCSFCPVSKRKDVRPEMKMSEELFKKIIDDLSRLEYTGELCTFSNNEPFLDERIIEFNKYAREKLPYARMHLYTNGTLLTIDKFVEIMKYLDELVIDNYQQELKMIKPVKEIYDYVENNNEYKGKVSIVLRKPIEILTSRGGDAPNRKDIKSFPMNSCALPFEQMVIRPDGKVSLCCNDPLGKITLGDLNNQSLSEVWYGEEYSKIRKKIVEGRGNIEHCKNCDTFYLY